MKILALELSSGRGSIAFVENGEARFAVEFANDRKHSGAFFENLQRLTADWDVPNRIVVGTGPGSHAGVRIAIATAVGLQAATGAELIGIPSICAVPTSLDEFCVIGDARRQTFYRALIRTGMCAEGPALYGEDELRAILATTAVAVFCTERLAQFPEAQIVTPSAALLARLAERMPSETATTPIEPMYLRGPHITYPKAVPFQLPSQHR